RKVVLSPTPGEGEKCRCNSKRQYIRNGIQLHSEFTRRLGHPGNSSIEAVQNNSNANGHCRMVIAAFESGYHAEVGAEHVADGEQARYERKAALQPFAARF